jgi:hypothetical protein
VTAGAHVRKELVQELLEELGDTAEEVADSLRLIEMTGDEESSTSCPVALYVREALEMPPGDLAIQNDGRKIMVRLHAIETAALDFDVKLPKPVKKFTKRFDKGRYKDLVSL